MAVTEFAYTGAYVDWVVPAGVTSLLIEAWGAQGEDSAFFSGGQGGYAIGTLGVTPAESLRVYVGGTAGFGGGGTVANGGGGASDVRQGGTALANRKIVGGGGGGGGSSTGGNGGAGGATTGSAGLGAGAGAGGTQSAGGAAGGATGSAGSSGQGGATDAASVSGSGGGGYYGGGGAGAFSSGNARGGGGGGSGYTGGVTSASMQTGVREGNGLVRFTYSDGRTTLESDAIVTIHESGAALDITAEHPEPDPDDNSEVVSFIVQRQESIDAATWQGHGPLGVVGEVDNLDTAGALEPAGIFTDWRIANRMHYRYRIVATGENGTTSTGDWTVADAGPSGPSESLDGGSP